jgi:uncharacterized RDD family membrane protein YckC
VTPEGVDLRLRVADGGQRAAALLLDACIILGAMIAMSLLAMAAGLGGAVAGAGFRPGIEVIVSVWLLGFFLLRNGYFIFFELRPRAATPGKRALGLRVASRDGGRLEADAVFARNAMREIEIFLPLSLLLSAGGDVEGWVALAGLVWCGVFVFFPLFNRDRLRVGDIVAGTWVVGAPRRRISADLADRQPAVGGGFTEAELDAYGVKELHVLEEVLRRRDPGALRTVAASIRKKLGRSEHADLSDAAFLDAYYGALRGRLEQRLLLGRRRRDKHDRP